MDENIHLKDMLKLLKELSNLQSENIFFALDNTINDIANIKYIRMTHFVKLLNIKKPMESNHDSDSILLKDCIK